MSYDYLFKYVIIGNSGTGKTGLLARFTENKYDENCPMTIGVEFGAKMVTHPITLQKIKLQCWDTAGSESFQSLTRAYYRNSAVALIVYDVTNRKSFFDVEEWYRRLRNATSMKLYTVLVGNKCDDVSNREVETFEGEDLAKEYDSMFFECSAKTGKNVRNVFEMVAWRLYKDLKSNNPYNVGVESFKSIQLRADRGETIELKKCCIVM